MPKKAGKSRGFAGIEQRIGESTRVKLLIFCRDNNFSNAESLHGSCPVGFVSHGFQAIERDYSRGAQIVLQSRSANRLSGWIGYTLAYARTSYYTSDFGPIPVMYWSPYYPTLADQRHTLSLFANYRLTPTLNLGGKFLFGSGFPVPSTANSVRQGDYRRLDLRAEKDWAFRHWKLATYGELLNAANHYNPRYFYVNIGGSVAIGQGLPITPTAGVAFEF